MRPMLATLALVLSLAVSPSAAAAQGRYERIFDELWSAVDQQLFDPNHLGVPWESLGPIYRAKARVVDNDAAFLGLMRELLAKLPTTHLRLLPPESRVRVGIGATTGAVDSASVVTAVDIASDAQRAGIRPGDVLLSDPSSVLGPPGSAAAITLRRCDNRVASLRVRREPTAWPPEQPYVRWRAVLRDLNHRIGYIKIGRFDDGAAPQVDSAMAGLANADSLIIDVRGNEGGNLSFLRMTSHLRQGPQLAAVLLNRTFLNRLKRTPEVLDRADLASVPKVSGAYTTQSVLSAFKDHDGGAAFYTEDLRDRTYTRPVVVLTDSRTASAAEGFVWSLKGRPNTTVVGRPTAGAVVGAETITLPDGWKLTLPTHVGWGPDGHIFRDQQLTPDTLVRLSRDALCRGFDADLAAALDVIGNLR